MSAILLTENSSNDYTISGDLTFATIDETIVNKLPFNQERISVDFAPVTIADSAGLALLVEWQKKATRKNITLQFKNLPQQIKALARLVEVNDLIKNTL
ncbi:MAG: STAS domain-containing protein [Methylococcales bacterium]|jgi:phospholipid transport system transporter-binding protein|nr:STAS domain-containing protein [Methylococcales bacterium]